MSRDVSRDPQCIVHPTVENVHGSERVECGMNELVVLCLVRDGRTYAPSASTKEEAALMEFAMNGRKYSSEKVLLLTSG
jgi:hypothetical protein